MTFASAAPPPPEGREALLSWAVAQGVEARLDDLLVAPDGAAGRTLPSRNGERLTYRDILLPAPRRSAFYEPRDARTDQAGLAPDEVAAWRPTALRYLGRMANLTRLARERSAFLEEHGQPPAEGPLADFAHRLLTRLRELQSQNEEGESTLRPEGTFEPVAVRVTSSPTPMLRYEERPLTQSSSSVRDTQETALLFLGWDEGPLRWQIIRGERASGQEVCREDQAAALEAMLAFLYDPQESTAHAALREHLRRPAWEVALGALDERLRASGQSSERASKKASVSAPPEERLAFRVWTRNEQVVDLEPVVQKRGARAGFSRGARVQWFQLPERKDLSQAERHAYQAYDDRFARRSQAWGGALSAAQIFGILRALVDHPAVLMEGAPQETRPDIRQGRLRLKFVAAADGSLTPVFELLGQEWSPSEVTALLREEAYLLSVHRPPHAVPQLLLAQVSPDTVAVMHALGTVQRFPPASHDALARRLESLQETVDIEFPSTWTKTIVEAAPQLLARLDLLASGALHVAIGVRPIRHGAVFAPGDGPALVLEGEGPARHGARRHLAGERRAAQDLAARLSLTAVAEGEPWAWRVSEGDPALHVVATLEDEVKETAQPAEPGEPPVVPVQVEWSGDGRVTFCGGVGLGHMRLKVADRKDWFGVDGGAQASRGRKESAGTVPLSELFAAIRDGRRYVAVGQRGFVRIEETLREALARAEESLVPSRQGMQISAASFIGQDPLRQLVADEAQIDASAAFRTLLRRLKEPPPDTDVEEALGPAWRGRLRPYQKAGVAWLMRMAHWGAGVVLADEMGLGKTIQTLAVLALRAAQGPALVVAPTSVVGNWLDEAARFVPQLRTNLYRGPERASLLKGLGPGDILVTSYNLATLDAEALAGVAFASLVLDEAQAVKNALTERARALRDLDVAWRIGLTGTPIENHLSEVWSIFRVVGPGLFGSWEDFRARYAVPIEKFRDEGRRHALARRLRPFVLRRTKAEVAPELPARTELTRKIQLSDEERGLYDQLRQATLDELADAKKNPDRDGQDLRFVLLAALTRLRQLCCHPRLVYPSSHVGSSKTAHLLELVASLKEDGHRMLVFSQFRTFLELLLPRLQQHGHRVLVLDGTTPAAARTQRIAAFQRGEADVFLISLKAGGFGLNLTAADTVIHLDPWWNPAVEDQATARAHRIGQDKPVTTLRLVAGETLEESVLSLHAAKRDLAQGILAGTDAAAAWDLDTLTDLIRANR